MVERKRNESIFTLIHVSFSFVVLTVLMYRATEQENENIIDHFDIFVSFVHFRALLIMEKTAVALFGGFHKTRLYEKHHCFRILKYSEKQRKESGLLYFPPEFSGASRWTRKMTTPHRPVSCFAVKKHWSSLGDTAYSYSHMTWGSLWTMLKWVGLHWSSVTMTCVWYGRWRWRVRPEHQQHTTRPCHDAAQRSGNFQHVKPATMVFKSFATSNEYSQTDDHFHIVYKGQLVLPKRAGSAS
jgi:hypothetical protein